MSAAEGLRIAAPAKVNLILRVLDRRPDGYHELWSLMQCVALEDLITFRLRPDSTGITLTSDDPSLPTDRRNLIVRAAVLVLDRAGMKAGLDIQVSKRIPVGAGLGGGSSDAAATIVALNRLLSLGWSMEDLSGLGEQLGSDVPFFFFGPTAVVQGRGQNVVPVHIRGRRWIVLIHPGFPIQTRWAYEQLSHSRKGVRPLSPAAAGLSAKDGLSWEEVIPLMENDFEEALTPTHAVLGDIKRELLGQGAEAALLSGSGSTVFGVFSSEAEAARAQERLGSARNRWSVRAATSSTPLSCVDTSSPEAGTQLTISESFR